MEAERVGILTERFKDFEVPVSDKLWDRLEGSLAQPKKSPRWLWAVAASLSLAVLLSFLLQSEREVFPLASDQLSPTISTPSFPTTDPVVEPGYGQSPKISKGNNPLPIIHPISAPLFVSVSEKSIIPFEPSNNLMAEELQEVYIPEVGLANGASVKIQLVFSAPAQPQLANKPRIKFEKLKGDFKREFNLKKMKEKAKSVFAFSKKNHGDNEKLELQGEEENLN